MGDALRLLVLLGALAAPAVAVAVPPDQDIETDDTAEAIGGAIATRFEAHELTVEGPCGASRIRFKVPTVWARMPQCVTPPDSPKPSNLSFELVCGPEAKAKARVRRLIARTPGRVRVVERAAIADGTVTVFRSLERPAKRASVKQTFVIATRARPEADGFVLMRAAVPRLQSDVCRAKLREFGEGFEVVQ